MPIYEYKCSKCEKVFEVLAKRDDKEPEHCLYCKEGKPQKLVSAGSFRMYGDGVYKPSNR